LPGHTRVHIGAHPVTALGAPRSASSNTSKDPLIRQICAERPGLVPITTPAYSPQSNGLSEVFALTLKRDYVSGADLGSAAVLLEQLPRWIAGCNAVAPHSALSYESPLGYRQCRQTMVINWARWCLGNWGALHVAFEGHTRI
jgi:hypothetical protein